MITEEQRDSIRKAADHIETYGLHKYTTFADFNARETSAACIYGALGLYVPDEDWQQVVTHVRKVNDNDYLSFWNDEPGTTKHMVVMALRRAADD